MKILVNFNLEEPSKLGYWYDAVVTEVKAEEKHLVCKITKGVDLAEKKGCRITQLEEFGKIIVKEEEKEEVEVMEVEEAVQEGESLPDVPER